MPGKYAEYLEDGVFQQAMGGDKEMQLRKLAIAQSIREVDSETSGVLMTALANAGMPEAHMSLSRLYLEGDHALGVDLTMALHHLTEAAGLGYIPAIAQLGAEYAGRGGGYSGSTGRYAIQINLDEAKKWYKRAGELGNTWAREALADLPVKGRRARDCSQEELSEIETLYKSSGSFFKLGNMYCVDREAGGCTEDEINTAKRWYRTGRSSQYSQCEKCAAILRLWDEPDYVSPQKKAPWTMTGILASAVGLILFSIIGTFLLGVAMTITSVTLPLVIVGAALVAIYFSFKSRRVNRMYMAQSMAESFS